MILPEVSTPPDPPVAPQREPTGHYRPLSSWTPWWSIGAAAVVMAAVLVILGIGGVALFLTNPGAIQRSGMHTQFSSPGAAYELGATLLLSQLVGVALTVWFAGRYGARADDVLALGRPYGAGRAYLWAVPLFAAFGFGVGGLMQWLAPQSNQADTQIMLDLTHSSARWLIFLAAVVFAPLQEELLFRGFLFSALARSRLGLLGTSIVTSACWAAIHGYSPAGDATIFLLGLALSFVLWRTGSTRVTMACHGCYNAIAFAAAAASTAGAG